jgi:predicted PurR-regulated permease PerM
LAVGFSLLGFRFPVMLAFVAAVAWAIPLVGGLVGVILVVIAAWPNGVVAVTLAALLTLVVYGVLEFYLEPRLYTRERYWRVLVLLVMLAMTDAFGLLGLLVAPPLATAIQLWLNDLLAPPAQAAETAPSLDLSDVHAKLETARTLIHQGDETPSPRIVNLFDRLEQLVQEVEQAETEAQAA